jgi:hypothetical protein
MDSQQFDALTRSLRSRRTIFSGLLGGSLSALLSLAEPEAAAAHDPLPTCRKIKNKQRRTRCLRRARRHNAQHRATSCTGVVCRSVANGTVTCRRGACVALTCDPGFGSCNGRVGDGCETNLKADAANCGKCGIVCPGSAPDRCVNGSCVQEFTTVGIFVYRVPARGTLRLEISGGQGGAGGRGAFGNSAGGPGGDGGRGSSSVTFIAVAAGEQLNFSVGGAGEPGRAGVDGAGGAGGTAGSSVSDTNVGERGSPGGNASAGGGGGGGGGAATDVRRAPFQSADRILLATGGGGGGGGAGGNVVFGSEGPGGAGGQGGADGGAGGAGGVPPGGQGDGGIPRVGPPTSGDGQARVIFTASRG